MGNQLVSLLNIDFESEKGRIALHKNAFALIRLGRLRHAIACMLCSKPPMLKEACRLANARMKDPMLALLIARLVEHPEFTTRSNNIANTSGGSNGYFVVNLRRIRSPLVQ